MKSRQDFDNLIDYKEYLIHYYAGQFMASSGSVSFCNFTTDYAERSCETAINHAEILVKKLNIER